MAISTLFRLALAVTRRILPDQQYDFNIAVAKDLDQQTAGLAQASWFIDPVNGNDANSGATSALALKTDAQRQRLWGNPEVTLLTQPTTVTYLSSPPTTDVVNLNVAYAAGASLKMLGTRTVTNPAIALTAVTALNRATQTPWDVTGVGLGAADIGRLMRITAGARINNYCGVAKDLTGGKVRVSPFLDVQIDATTGIFVSSVGVTPQIGDVVEVFTVPVITIGTWRARALTNVPFSNVGGALLNCVLADSLQLDGTGAGNTLVNGMVAPEGVGIIFYRQCIAKNLIFGGAQGHAWAGGILSNVITASQSVGFSTLKNVPQMTGFLANALMYISEGTSCAIGFDCLFQDCGLTVNGNCSGNFVSFFDRSVANASLLIGDGLGVYRSVAWGGVADLLWGDNALGVAVKVLSGGQLIYTNKPTVNTPTGAGRESIIGGTNTDWAGVPVVTAANNAAIVVRQ